MINSRLIPDYYGLIGIHFLAHLCILHIAHMRHFPSVCLSRYQNSLDNNSLDNNSYLWKYQGKVPITLTGNRKYGKLIGTGLKLWQVGLIANVKLHFLSINLINNGLIDTLIVNNPLLIHRY